MYRLLFKNHELWSNNSVNINFIQKVLGTKSLYCKIIIRTYLFTYFRRVNSFEVIVRNVPVTIQKPRVVSNNSVNINFSKNVLEIKSLACELIINLPLFTYSCRINNFEDIERNVPVTIQKPRVVSNNSVNINFSQKVPGTKSLACEMTKGFACLLIFVGLIVSKILWEMYRSGFRIHELCQVTP